MKRDTFTMPLDLGRELIIDNFAGGGGTSTGLQWAFGRPVDIAINHDPEALAMHAANHPFTRHLCENVWDVDPIKVTGNQPVGLVWLSPDCKHFSKAKGGTPVSKKIRGLAWVGLRWVAKTKPRILMLENVEEFQDWGPLIVDADGSARPDPAKKGKTFESFVRQLRGHGYSVEWRERRACNSGSPTIRKRLFLIARRDGLPIVWPKPTHVDPLSREAIVEAMQTWKTAADIVDFSIKSESIFDRKKPLVRNTLRRVARGAWRHVLATPTPYIVSAAQRGEREEVAGAALATMRGTSDGHMGGHALTMPLSTISSGGTHHGLITAYMVTRGYGERPGQEARTQSMQQPVNTPVAGGVKQGVTMAHLTKYRTGNEGQDLRRPVPTITANSYVKRPGGAAPLGLVSACLEQAYGGFNEGNDGRPVDQPVSTIMSKGANQRLITAYCIKYYSNGGQWQGLDEPMHTLPTKARIGLVQTTQMPVADLTESQQRRAKQCADLLREHLPEHFSGEADMALVVHAGEWYVLVDITLRMLKARELFNAQGFPPDYEIDWIPDPALLFVDGEQVADPRTVPRLPLTETAKVRMVGNSVSPQESEQLARANFAHERALYGEAA